MVGTPKPPLRYRRRGSSDYRVHGQELNIPLHSATSYTFAAECTMPCSPSFYSSSSVAPSSPVRSLYTPEPSSSPIAEHFIASSPKSPTYSSGRKGFWEVAFNYGPDFPYKARPNVQASNSSREQFITRRRSSSASAPPLVSDADASEYSEDIDPFHMDDDNTDEDSVPGNVKIANPKDEAIWDGGRGSHLSHDISETRNNDKLLPGEIDVAAVLLDLSRPVRFASVESKPDTISIKPKLPVTLDLPQSPSTLPDVPSQAEEETRSFVPIAQQTGVTPSLHDVTATEDIEVPIRDDHDIPERSNHPEVTEVEPASPEPTTDVFVDDVQDQSNSTKDVPSSRAEPEDLTSESIVREKVDNTVTSQPMSGSESSTDDASCMNVDEKKIDSVVDSIFSCPLTPISSPSLAGSELSELTELLSEPPSPRNNAVHEFTGLPDGTRHAWEGDSDMLSGPTSPVPGPSRSQSSTVDQHDAPTERKIGQETGNGRVHAVKAAEIEQKELDSKSRKKRARSESSTASRPPSPRSSASCSAIPKSRKKRTKRASDDSGAADEDQNNPPLLPNICPTSACASSVPPDPQTNAQSSAIPKDDDADAKTEMCGCLIQTMALSRASSMPASSLVREVLRENPHLANKRDKSDLLGIASVVLASNSVFGRIDRQGFDADDKPLEAQWFYIPENDPDQERASLLREMMPKKRNETKKYKQYFFKPLGKISRWDPEDAL